MRLEGQASIALVKGLAGYGRVMLYLKVNEKPRNWLQGERALKLARPEVGGNPPIHSANIY